MKKLIVICGIFLFAFAVSPVFAAGAVQHNSCADVPYPIFSGSGCNFQFWDGNGELTMYEPTFFHDVITPSGVETELIKGVVPNGTGLEVAYSANSGSPVAPGQTCYSFVTQKTTTNWQETIDADGNFTLVCHFQK